MPAIANADSGTLGSPAGTCLVGLGYTVGIAIPYPAADSIVPLRLVEGTTAAGWMVEI